jgi:hypothetical protein
MIGLRFIGTETVSTFRASLRRKSYMGTPSSQSNLPRYISLTIRNVDPVELTDFTSALLALADEYNRLWSGESTDAVVEDVRLYVKEMRPGSIVADLIALAPGALPFVENSNHVFAFVGYLKTAFDALLGQSVNPKPLDRSSYENLSSIVDPVAKDAGASLSIATVNFNAPVTINLNHVQANAIQNAAKRKQAELAIPVMGTKEKVLLYWYQARNDSKSSAGDRAIVETIHANPVKVVFANESIKAKILSASENPFKMAYVVDLVVETIRGRPKLYRIIEMHEVIENERDA